MYLVLIILSARIQMILIESALHVLILTIWLHVRCPGVQGHVTRVDYNLRSNLFIDNFSTLHMERVKKLDNEETENHAKTFAEFENKHVFHLKQYALDTGRHILYLTVSESAEGRCKAKNSAQCLITIRPEMPIPIILGGIRRTVPSNKRFMLQGNQSANMDIPPWEIGELHMKWYCESKPDKYLCDTVINEVNRLLVPSSAAVSNTDFKFKLEVRTKHSPWISVAQIVQVRDGAKQIYIKCLKNCEGSSSYLSVTYLRADCVDCPNENYEWSMEAASEDNQKKSLDFKSETEYGQNNPDLLIKEGVLVPGDKYKFTVKYKDGFGEATEKIEMIPLPKKGECRVEPMYGTSLSTLYNVACKNFQHVDTLNYQLFQRSETASDYGILLAASADCKFSLYLSSEKKTTQIRIRAIDINGLFVDEFLNFIVSSKIDKVPTDSQIKTYLKIYTGENGQPSVAEVIASGNKNGALQLINAFITEAGIISTTAPGYKDFKKNWKRMIVEDMNKFPIESFEEVRKVAATLRKLNEEDTDEVVRVFGKLATQLCRKTATELVYNVNKMQIVNTRETVDISQDLKVCADTNMKANLNDLESDRVDFVITTAFPVLTLPAVPEDYPNYDDADFEYAKRLRDYKEITKNCMDIQKLIGVGVGGTLASGEPLKEIGKNTKVQVVTDAAKNLATKTLGDSTCFVKGSADLRKFSDATVTTVIVLYDRSPFWWNNQAKHFSMGVIDVNYYLGNRKITKLKRPMELKCTAKSITPEQVMANVSVLTDFKEWVPEVLDYSMTVHRIDVKKGSALFIQFYGLSGNDKIQVVITYNRRPHAEDFEKPLIMNAMQTVLKVLFPSRILKYGDAWFYVAVLPEKSMITGSSKKLFTYNYKVSFMTASCVYWKENTEEWSSRSCQTGKDTRADRFHCYCKHRSAYSGLYSSASSKIDRLLYVPFTLVLQNNYIVFIFVCIVFGLYCIALIFDRSKQRESPKEIYFLSDNAEYERYAYLITVKTGNRYSAGTTSNISIKIFGAKCDSKSHILNYPDPDKRFLQRGGKDYFVLTTERYLGEIREIYLWHDSVGFRPSWYCEWLSISDLQNDKEWYFKVNKWFSVVKEEQLTFLILVPSEYKTIRNWYDIQKMLISIKQEHNWNMWNIQENDLSYVQKLTIVLSIVLTTFSLALMMYGVPGMHLKDSISYYGHYGVYPFTVLVAFCSSVLSFFLHLGFIILFRKSLRRNEGVHIEVWKRLLLSPNTAWVLLLFTILTFLTFLIFFGFWVPYVTSLLWLSSVIGSFIQSVVLLENMYILFKLFYWQKEHKLARRSKIDPIQATKGCEDQRLALFSRFGGFSLRPYFSSKYRPLTREVWKVKREEQFNKSKIAQLTQDLIMFLIYVILLYVVVLANKDELNVYSYREIKDLVYGVHTRTAQFEEIASIEGFYEYVNETLLPCIHSSNWYGTWQMIEPGLMADFNIKILGIARFRQLRVRENSCKVAKILKKFNFTCSPEYSYSHNDKGEYMENWKPKEYVLVPRLIGVWEYKHDAMPSIGDMAIYPGAGYSAPFGRTLYNSYYNLQYYVDTEWIDYNSRAIFVEFLAYNANYNIFHAVKLILERSASGLHLKSHNICSTRLLFVKLELEFMLFVSFLLFITVILIMLIKYLYTATTKFKIFIRDPWNIVDVFIVLMSFMCIGIYMYRSRLVGGFLKQLETRKNNEFVNYFGLMYMEELFTVLAAILICVATIRLWKFLRFGIIFRIMENTLVLSGLFLIAIGIVHLILLLMYGFAGYIMFGANSYDFRDLTGTFTSLVLLSLNLYQHFDFDFIQKTHGGLGYVYYTSYMLITLAITTVYIAIIVMSYTESCIYYSEIKQYYTVQNYIKDESIYLKELIKRKWRIQRLVGGADDNDENNVKKKVTPKSDEHRYADSVVTSTHRINVMSLIARCVVLNLNKQKSGKAELSKEEVLLMRKVILILFGKQGFSENPIIAFVGHEEGNKAKFVSNNRILEMESVVNYILNLGTMENLKIQSFDTKVGQNDEKSKNRDTKLLEDFEDALKTILAVISNIDIVVPNVFEYKDASSSSS